MTWITPSARYRGRDHSWFRPDDTVGGREGIHRQGDAWTHLNGDGRGGQQALLLSELRRVTAARPGTAEPARTADACLDFTIPSRQIRGSAHRPGRTGPSPSPGEQHGHHPFVRLERPACPRARILRDVRGQRRRAPVGGGCSVRPPGRVSRSRPVGSRGVRPRLPLRPSSAPTTSSSIGSGAAGMTAALTAAKQGLSCVVVEKAPTFGGSAARSGAGIWLPNNR